MIMLKITIQSVYAPVVFQDSPTSIKEAWQKSLSRSIFWFFDTAYIKLQK
jgi:hypothetical protein